MYLILAAPHRKPLLVDLYGNQASSTLRTHNSDGFLQDLATNDANRVEVPQVRALCVPVLLGLLLPRLCQVQLNAIRGPGSHAATEEVSVFSPDRAV